MMARPINSGDRGALGRLGHYVLAAALASAAGAAVVALSLGIAMVPAFAVGIFVGIVHGTEDGRAYQAIVATWVLAIPVIWVVGAAGIAVGVREWLKVPAVVPLLAALAAPVFIATLIAAGEAQTAVEIVGTARRIVEPFVEPLLHLTLSVFTCA